MEKLVRCAECDSPRVNIERATFEGRNKRLCEVEVARRCLDCRYTSDVRLAYVGYKEVAPRPCERPA